MRARCSSRVCGCSWRCSAPRPGSGLPARLGTEAQGLGGMLGCLFGYVAGGLLGRTLDRALGAVERKVDRELARPRARRHARRARRRRPRARADPARRRCSSRRTLAVVDRRPRRVDLRLARLPHRGPPERGGARDARPVDAPARARAGVRRARRPARRHVGGDGRPAPAARPAPVCSAAISWWRASCSTRCRVSPTRPTT